MKKRILVYFLLGVYLTFIWLDGNKLFAIAEEGMFFHSVERDMSSSMYHWQEIGTGYIVTTALPKMPLLLLLRLTGMYFSQIYVQHIFFLLLIFLGQWGMYILVRHITKKNNVSFVAGLFYLLNLFTMTQVLARSLITGIITWTYIPIFLYLYLAYIDKGKKMLLLLLSTLIFSYVFSSPANLITFFGVSFFNTVCLFFSKPKTSVNVIRRSIIFYVVWGLINLVWLYPYVYLASSAFVESSNVDLNLESLRGVSWAFPLSEVLQLRQKFFLNSYMNPEAPWGTLYESWFTYVLTWSVACITFLGVFKSKKVLKSYTSFFIFSFFSLIFLTKGTNPPFGDVFYETLFTKIPITAVYRNSYEKLGFLYIIFYSIFFAIGLDFIFSKSKKIAVLISVLVMGLLVLPMWRGDVFTDYAKVKIPEYYNQADQLISKDYSDGRILTLPMLSFHGIRYEWGYRGDESSHYLFQKTAISKNVKKSVYWDEYQELFDQFENQEDITQNLIDQNVKFIIFDHSVFQDANAPTDRDIIQSVLDNNESINYLTSFGELDIYEFTDYIPQSLIYLEGEGELVYEKQNPQHYKVYVTNATSPHKVIFKSTFNNLWQAKINGQLVGSHFLALGFANGWEVQGLGNYVIDIKLKVWPWD